MKKRYSLLLILVVFCGVLIITEFFYPPLPINSVSRKDAIEQVNNSSGEIVKLSEENRYLWYISEMKGEKTYENLKRMMEEKGWDFKKQVDAGFIFTSNQGEMIVLSSMWTKKYIIFHFPKEVFNKEVTCSSW